jgi:hypothetical protein
MGHVLGSPAARCWPIVLAGLLGHPHIGAAQALSHRGFVEGTAYVFPLEASNDPENVVGDLLAREEVSARPAKWLLLAAGLDLRANTNQQVEDSWEPDLDDRGRQRPRLSMRRLAATLTRGRFTLEAGRQFVRWGKTDIVVPTDRFAPRDFLTVVDAPYLAIAAVRGTVQFGRRTLEAVLAPHFTPSRIPLLDQRWTVIPSDLPPNVSIMERSVEFPTRSQAGLRWGETRDRFEYSVSFFDGFNHVPNFGRAGPVTASGELAISRSYPSLRSYGADAAIPFSWFTLKTEAAYFTSSSASTDEYVLYAIQIERQTGEWLLIAGYAGEAVTEDRVQLSFDPDRGLSKTFLGRASYTIDPNRSLVLESAVRQNLDGVYLKAEYSLSLGQHWRATAAGVLLAGEPDDFIGHYRRNSHLRLVLRYSF